MLSDQEILIISCTVLLGCIAAITLFHCMKLFCRNPDQMTDESEEQSDDDPQSIQVIVKVSPLRMYREEDPVAPV
jgi:hypothetical protein